MVVSTVRADKPPLLRVSPYIFSDKTKVFDWSLFHGASLGKEIRIRPTSSPLLFHSDVSTQFKNLPVITLFRDNNLIDDINCSLESSRNCSLLIYQLIDYIVRWSKERYIFFLKWLHYKLFRLVSRDP